MPLSCIVIKVSAIVYEVGAYFATNDLEQSFTSNTSTTMETVAHKRNSIFVYILLLSYYFSCK